MKDYKEYQGTFVAPGSKLFELLDSKNPEDQRRAKRLHEFCTKAANCGYVLTEMQKLREYYSDVV